MSNTIPKEKQSAYERWEMASFGETKPKAKPTTTTSVARLAEQLSTARDQARAEGYAEGLAQGRQAGYEEGRKLAEQEVLTLKTTAESFQQEVAQANELIAQDLLDLALDLAKAMLKSALSVHPEHLLPIISEAIHYLPTVQQPALLWLHPEDAVIVRKYMGEEISKAGWRISEDPHIERGGCRVETASNQIDATNAVRWQRIAAALSRNSDWLSQ